MLESFQTNFTQQELDQLQRLRASVLAFQKGIGSLPADDQSNPHNEQFNHLRREAKTLLKESGFDQKVPKAITEDMLIDRSQKVVIPRLSAIVIFGVILALLGLGINSIILEDVLINSLGCLISSSGMLLIMGAFVVLGMNLRRRRLTDFGDLYQRCNTLLYEIDHALNMAIPNWANRPEVEIPQIPSVVELALDSLNKQAADWQQKLKALEEQRLTAGPRAPMELIINIDFVQRELNRVYQELDRINGRIMTSSPEERPTPIPKRVITPAAREIAAANTAGMPVSKSPPAAGSGQEAAGAGGQEAVVNPDNSPGSHDATPEKEDGSA